MGNKIETPMNSAGLQKKYNDNEPQIISKSEDEIGFTDEQLHTFIEMFEKDKVIHDFLIFDRCCILADKYLLAMCFVYFVRAKLQLVEYDRPHLFAALYLAHILEEDDETLRLRLIPWANAPNIQSDSKNLLTVMNKMWHAMNFRSLVSKFSCCQVISRYPDANIWQRIRPDHHGNAYRTFRRCINCEPEPFNDIFDEYDFDDDVYYGEPKSITHYASENSSFSIDNESCDGSSDDDNSTNELTETDKSNKNNQGMAFDEDVINDQADNASSDDDDSSADYLTGEYQPTQEDQVPVSSFSALNKRKCLSYDDETPHKASRKIVKRG